MTTRKIEANNVELIRDTYNRGFEKGKRAGIKEAGIQLGARIGGVDEFIDWSDEGLRLFRNTTLHAIKDLLKEWDCEANT